jgi:hypothetical protein
MSTHSVQDTEGHTRVDRVDTQDVIMTTTGPTTTETLSSPASSRSRRGVVAAAGLIVFATVTLSPWLLTSGSDPQRSVTLTQAAASPQHAARGHASARSYAPNIEPLTAYALFCQNSLSLCAPAAATPPNPGYVRFCWNSPTLCTVLKPN